MGRGYSWLMTIEKLIGLGLMACGAVIATLAWMQSLLQHDSATLPLQTALPWALTAILTGAVAFKVGQRMTAKSRWARFMTR